MSDTQAKNDPKDIQKAIDAILAEMDNHKPYSVEYITMVEQLEKLYKVKETTKPDRVSKDALLNVGGSLAGIVAIIGYERFHIITSKALGFVIKTRI